MNYTQFKEKYFQEILPNKHKDCRKGQALMNFLGDIWIEEYKRITASNVDCFYNDNVIDACLNHLEKNWDNFFLEIQDIYYTISDEANDEQLTGERTILAYYINNNKMVTLLDLNISIIDNSVSKLKEELLLIGFNEKTKLILL